MSWIAALMLAAGAVPATRDVDPLAYTELPDPSQESAARALMETLRCLVCQGQSIADSDAAMAGDMRALVRQRVAQGQRTTAIREWLIARYGRYVSYDPPFDPATAMLWIAPVLLLSIGTALSLKLFRRRQ